MQVFTTSMIQIFQKKREIVLNVSFKKLEEKSTLKMRREKYKNFVIVEVIFRL